jgi:hypothetical protein
MSAGVEQFSATAADAVIVGADIAAGHDGLAELFLSVRHENGIVGTVVLDSESGFKLIEASGAGSLAGLIGRSWREAIKGL